MKNKSVILVIAILFFAGLLRLYKISNPIADWHSWRQADTSAVTRNFVKHGFTPFVPRFDDVSNIPSGRDNPEGYRMVEFPVYNSVAYFLYVLYHSGFFTVEVWQRLISIFASLGSLLLLYLISVKLSNKKTALIVLFLGSILPFYVFYSRAILPESCLLFLIISTLYISILYYESKSSLISKLYFVLLVVVFALALVIKPTAVFFVFPVIYMLYLKLKKPLRVLLAIVVFFAFSFLPLFLWRNWISQFPEGIPAWAWLLNGDNIRFKGAFFYWLVGERYSKLILGYAGLAFVVPGILYSKGFKKPLFYYLWGVGAVLYASVFATGNVKHDYYQVITIPILLLFMGNGLWFYVKHAGILFPRLLTYFVVITMLMLSISLSYYYVRGYYWINNPAIVEAGRRTDKLIPEDAKVIAPYGGDTAFLYQTNRRGWPIGFSIDDKIKQGANYYVSVSPNDPEAVLLSEKYKIIEKNDSYILIQLQ
jgi:hypothetical protein